MSTVRLRRLQADYEKVRDYVNRHPRLQLIQADGTPPERYQLEYRIRSLRQTDDDLLTVKSHMVEIALPLNYPRMPPQCRMLTPIFHPNIAPHAICIGDHWSPGEPLWSIVARIGEMIAYQSYNTRSPLNGEAARWVDQHVDELPLDPVSMMPDDEGAVAAAVPSTSPPRPVAAATASKCSAATTHLRARGAGAGTGGDVATNPRGRAPFRLPPVRRDRPMASRAGREAVAMPSMQDGVPMSGVTDAIRADGSAEATSERSIASPSRARHHRQMLAIACTIVILAFVLVEVANGRVAVRGFTRYPLPETCISRSLFGLNCPGCGLTRSIIHLAEGDWRASWRSHRLGGLFAAVIVFQVPYRLLALRRPDRPVIPTRWLTLFGYLLIAMLIGNWLIDLVAGQVNLLYARAARRVLWFAPVRDHE